MLGIGTEKGGRIPVEGKDSFMRDSEGFVVISKLNEEMAGNIAKAGKGTYVRVDNTNNAQTIIENELDKLQKDDVRTEVYTKYREQFEVIAMLVLLLLVAEIVIITMIDSFARKNKGSQK